MDSEPSDRVLLISEGRIIAAGMVDELRETAGSQTLIVESLYRLPKERLDEFPEISTRNDGRSLVIEFGDGANPADLIKVIGSAGVRFIPTGLGEVLYKLSNTEA